jgi:hypothetical protein
MEQLYSIEDVAKMMGVSWVTIYRQVAFCQDCGKKINTCMCEEFNPSIKALNASGSKKNIKWRIPMSLLEKELKKRVRKIR